MIAKKDYYHKQAIKRNYDQKLWRQSTNSGFRLWAKDGLRTDPNDLLYGTIKYKGHDEIKMVRKGIYEIN